MLSSLGAFSISPDHQRLAYSLDTSGDEVYELYIKAGQRSGQHLPFADCDGSMTWPTTARRCFSASWTTHIAVQALPPSLG